jgi:hypothetical protein
MPVLRSSLLRVLGELEGEDMLKFRHGKDLYPYCTDCLYSAYTPATHVLGCTMGDDPEVVEFSKEVDADPDVVNSTKCPGFSPKNNGEDNQGFQDEASLNAVLVKEIPSKQIPDSPEAWQVILHELSEDMRQDPETAQDGLLLEQGLHFLNDDAKSSVDGRPQDYDQFDYAPGDKEASKQVEAEQNLHHQLLRDYTT